MVVSTCGLEYVELIFLPGEGYVAVHYWMLTVLFVFVLAKTIYSSKDLFANW